LEAKKCWPQSIRDAKTQQTIKMKTPHLLKIKVFTLYLMLIFVVVGCTKTEKSYYTDGTLKAEIEMKDDLKNGNYIEHYPSGKLKVKAQYINDTINGPFLEYYENGELMSEAIIKNGLLEGIWRSYHKNKKLKSEVIYLHDIINGNATFYSPAGNLTSKKFYKDGEVVYNETYGLDNSVDSVLNIVQGSLLREIL